MSFRFRVRLCNFRAELSHERCVLLLQFGKYKELQTTGPTIVNTNLHQREREYFCQWKFNEEFYINCRATDSLENQFFVIQCLNDDRDLIGSTQVDLYTLACGPLDHDLVLVKENRSVGSIRFRVEMEQINDIEIIFQSLNIQLDSPSENFVVYKCKGSTLENTSEVSSSGNWKGLKMRITASLQNLLSQTIIIQLYRNSLFCGECQIPLKKYLKVIEGNESKVRFHETIMHDKKIFNVDGLLQFFNLPTFAQLLGGLHVSNGIVDGTVLISGAKLPKLPQVKLKANVPQQISESTPKVVQCTFDKRVISMFPHFFRVSNYLLVAEYAYDQFGYRCGLQSTHAITALRDMYFEITIHTANVENQITIGLTRTGFPFMYHPGFDEYSYGYRSDTGAKLHADAQGYGELYGPRFGAGDVIGCGINAHSNAMYFTKNGKFLGYAFFPVPHSDQLLCTVSIMNPGVKVSANFGQHAFVFDVKKSDLPSGWNLNLDKFGRFYFDNPGANPTFVDPREEKPEWMKYNLQNDNFVNTLTKWTTIRTKYEDVTTKIRRWQPIRSPRVLSALHMIPRAAFVPKQLIQIANNGRLITGRLNNTDFTLLPTRLVARAFEALDIRPGMKFLDIGSGTGWRTAVGSYMVGEKGVAIGLDTMETMIDFAYEKTIQFSKQSGITFGNISFQKRNVFIMRSSLDKPYIVPVEASESFDAIFCGVSITREQLKDIQYLLHKGGRAIGCINGVMYLFTKNGNTLSEKPLIKINFPSLELPNKEEIILEKKRRIKEYILRLGIQEDVAYKAINDFKNEDTFKMNTALFSYQEINYEYPPFSYEDVKEALEMYHYNATYALGYLNNIRFISTTYNISPKRVKELFQAMNGDINQVMQTLQTMHNIKEQNTTQFPKFKI